MTIILELTEREAKHALIACCVYGVEMYKVAVERPEEYDITIKAMRAAHQAASKLRQALRGGNNGRVTS